jgi:hypothetical protein
MSPVTSEDFTSASAPKVILKEAKIASARTAKENKDFMIEREATDYLLFRMARELSENFSRISRVGAEER